MNCSWYFDGTRGGGAARDGLKQVIGDWSAAANATKTMLCEDTQMTGPPLGAMQKRLLSNSKALDGGPALYYIQPAVAESPNSDKWVVFLEGGGVCQHHADCYGRKFGSLGSASVWNDFWTPDGSSEIISNDPALNPDREYTSHPPVACGV